MPRHVAFSPDEKPVHLSIGAAEKMAAAGRRQAAQDTDLERDLLPAGWPPSAKPSPAAVGLLAEFLALMGPARDGWAKPIPRAGDQLPEVEKAVRKATGTKATLTPEEQLAQMQQERDEAEPLLGKLLPLLRKIPVRRIPSNADRAALRAIAQKWNGAIRVRHWWFLPPICETCCVPMVRRGFQQVGGDQVLATVCGERCRDARKHADN